MKFQPGAGPRFRRSLLFMAAGWLWALSTEPTSLGSPLEAQIDSVLRRSYPSNGPGAAVIVVQRGKTLLRKGFGLADLEHGTPVVPDDIFRVGSITKEFTAVSILQLVAAGKLHLDDEITHYVPDFPTHGQRITLAHLLTHTSGIRNYTADAGFRALPLQDLSLAQILAFIKDKPPNFAPGSHWAYCNTGYVLLGAVIEKVSGQSYEAYLQDHVFKAAGLTHTFYGNARKATPGEIPGYSRTLDKKWTKAVYLNATQAFSAGALLSTVDDLRQWEQALAEGRVVRPDLLALARSPARFAGGREQAGYGLGWELGYIDGQPSAGHGGTISGFRTYEVSVPSLGLYIAILCNSDRPPADPEQVAEQISRLAADEIPLRLGASAARRYAGVYRSSPTRDTTVTVEDGQVLLEPPGLTPRLLRQISPGIFIDPESSDWYAFRQDPTGQMRSVEIRPRSGGAMVLPRLAKPLGARLLAIDAEASDRTSYGK